MSTLFVGIDVSKDSFTATAINTNGDLIFSLSTSMDISGFSELLNSILTHSNDLSSVLVAMEATGCYYLNLFSYLIDKGINTVVLNPLLISNFAKLSLRKTKTDKKDALTIAKFLLYHKDSIQQHSLPQDIKDIRDIAREREALARQIASLKNQIKGILQITFPELEPLCNIFTLTMLHFLKEFPSARLIRTSNPEIVAQTLKRCGQGRKIGIKAEDIIRAASTSVGHSSLSKELILPRKIDQLLYLMEQLEEITKILNELCQSIMIEEMEIVTSVDGIGEVMGATFLAEIGSIERFPSYRSLIAYAGLDPAVKQSGKFMGEGKISKRGNRHLRRIVYLMAVSVINHNAYFRAYFLKRRREGVPYKKAVVATAHKLLRTIFSMLTNKTFFHIKEVNSL